MKMYLRFLLLTFIFISPTIFAATQDEVNKYNRSQNDLIFFTLKEVYKKDAQNNKYKSISQDKNGIGMIRVYSGNELYYSLSSMAENKSLIILLNYRDLAHANAAKSKIIEAGYQKDKGYVVGIERSISAIWVQLPFDLDKFQNDPESFFRAIQKIDFDAQIIANASEEAKMKTDKLWHEKRDKVIKDYRDSQKKQKSGR